MKLDKSKKVLAATFSPWIRGQRLTINGNLEPMVDFFLPRVKKFTLIDQVYPGSDFVMPRIEEYKGRKMRLRKSSKWLFLLYPLLRLTNKEGTRTTFKIRDFLSVIDEGFKDEYDIFIGFEAINAIAGILLKKAGRVKKVIYYVSDYSPNRYKNKLFNNFYLFLDRFAAYHSDYIWDVSKAMQPARIKAGLKKEKSAAVIHVPNALYTEQIKYEETKNIEPYSLVFLGTLGRENGPDLAIKSTPLVLKKIPKVKLHIIGGGRDIERLKKLAKKLKVEKNVVFHGFISDRKKISRTIRKFMIALAPYPHIPGSARYYGDATKIRAYLASGLPVITTSVPPLGKEASEKGAAALVKDSKRALAEEIMRIMNNREIYFKMRRNAIKFAKDNTWKNEFNKAFKKMQDHEDNS